MFIEDFITYRDINQLKRLAKKRSKSKLKPHSEYLNDIAQEFNFKGWHQLIKKYENNSKVEKHFYDGCTVIFDEKNADSVNEDQVKLTEDWRLSYVGIREFAQLSKLGTTSLKLRVKPKEEIKLKPRDFEQAIEDREFFRFFRYNSKSKIDLTPRALLEDIHDTCFFPPDYVSIRGVYYSVLSDNRVVAW